MHSTAHQYVGWWACTALSTNMLVSGHMQGPPTDILVGGQFHSYNTCGHMQGLPTDMLVGGQFLIISEALCPSLCLFGTILVTLCLMVWDWRVSRAESMLSCWHDLLFLFYLLLFYLFLPSMGWLCGVRVFGLIECSHSLPALHSGLHNNNNNNNTV